MSPEWIKFSVKVQGVKSQWANNIPNSKCLTNPKNEVYTICGYKFFLMLDNRRRGNSLVSRFKI